MAASNWIKISGLFSIVILHIVNASAFQKAARQYHNNIKEDYFPLTHVAKAEPTLQNSNRQILPKLSDILSQLDKLKPEKFPENLSQNRDSKCYVCKTVTFMLQQTFLHKDDEFSEIIRAVCTYFEDKDICVGIVKLFKTEVITVLSKLVIAPNQLCGLILGPSCGEFYNPYEMWNISLPSRPTNILEAPNHPLPNKPSTLRVLHVSDIHVDMKYVEGSNADCERPLCCRNTSGPVKIRAGRWGSLAHCDLPYRTLEDFFKYISQNDKFDYVYWTGDLPSHADWDQNRQGQLNLIQNLTDLFLKYLPNTPVFWSLGNHESVPVNSFPPPYIKGNDSMDWLYGYLSKVWTRWLPTSTVYNITRGGFYTVQLSPGFQLVSLNMNFCNKQNWWMFLNTTDPAEELQWFVSILYQAELARGQVHVIGHIPPGNSACMKAWSWNYYRIVDRFSKTITGQFFGHTHTDSMEIFYDLSTLTKPIAVAYIGPGLTTFIKMNPGYRVYTIDGFHNATTWTVLDHETYFLNMTAANLNDKTKWSLEYTAKKDYGLEDLTPSSWQKFTERLLTDNQTIELFNRHYYKSSPGYTTCDEDCRKSLVCEIRQGRSNDLSLCDDLGLEEVIYKQYLTKNTMC